jgi:plastocyanin
MRSKSFFIFSSLAVFALMLTACGANSPAENTTNDIMEDPGPPTELTPSVEVSDQDASGGMVTVQKVTAANPGWIVIHTESDGAPGPIIGFAQVSAGENNAVDVEIDLGGATEKLFAMLHIDAGTLGSYEFPGDDAPVKNGDAVVMTPFMITAETSTGSSMDEVVVMVKDSKYEAKELTVQAGTTVTWIMDASFPHTVTADDGSFDSGRMSNGQSFSFTFDQPGEFPFYCTLHGGTGGAGMAGTVTVTD